jgi:hypothetical protein
MFESSLKNLNMIFFFIVKENKNDLKVIQIIYKHYKINFCSDCIFQLISI